MATNGTNTERDICNAALRVSGIAGVLQESSAEEMHVALSALNRMLKQWQTLGYATWRRSRQTITLVAGQSSYSLSGRPLEIETCRYKKDGVENPMLRMMRKEYDELSQKDTTGIPTQFYYDRQREDENLVVWPVPQFSEGTLELTVQSEIEDITSDGSAVVDIPAEFYNAAVYGVAEELCLVFGILDARTGMISAKYRESLDQALAFDADESVFFQKVAY